MSNIVLVMRALVLLLSIALAACGVNDEPPGESETETRTFDESPKADAVNAMRLRTSSMSLWLDSGPKARVAGDKIVWTLNGRVSKNLRGVKAFVAGRSYVDTNKLSPRKFEIVLSAREMSKVLSGEALFMEFEPERGAYDYYSGMVRIQARFWAQEGTDLLTIDRWLVPVITGSGVVLRATVDTEPGYELQYVFTDDDQEPELTFNPDWRWWVDWEPGSIQFAADFALDPVYFYVHDGADTQYRGSAVLQLKVREAGVSTLSPEEAWPDLPCEDEVDACLNSLPSWANDTFGCGDAAAVRACLNAVRGR